MKLNYSPHFLRNYSKAPADIQRAFEKQALLLVENPRHPSLRTKKYDESAASGRPALPGVGVSTSQLRAIPAGCSKSKPIPSEHQVFRHVAQRPTRVQVGRAYRRRNSAAYLVLYIQLGEVR